MNTAFGFTCTRPLDRKAFLILGIAWLLAVALLILRSWAFDRIDPGFLVITSDAENRVWAVTQNRLIVTTDQGELLESGLLSEFGIKALPIDATPLKAGAGILTDQGLYACNVRPLKCRLMPLSHRVSQGKVTYSASRDEIALTDNQQGVVYLLDAGSGRLKTASSSKTTLMNHPNKPIFANNMLVVANTGCHALVGWPLVDGETPSLGEPATTVLRTEQQPYYLARHGEEWMVLEGGSVLSNGQLRRYGNGNLKATVPTGLKDATGLTAASGKSLLLSGYDDKTVTLFTGNTAKPFFAPSAQALLEQHFAGQHSLSLVSRFAGIAAIAVFIAPILTLLAMGYNLNQAIGSATNPAKPAAAVVKHGPMAVSTITIDRRNMLKIDAWHLGFIGLIGALLLLVLSIRTHDFRTMLPLAFLIPFLVGIYFFQRRHRMRALPVKLLFMRNELLFDRDGVATGHPYNSIAALIHERPASPPVIRLVYPDGQLRLDLLHTRGYKFLGIDVPLDSNRLAALLTQHLPQENLVNSPLKLYGLARRLRNKSLIREIALILGCVLIALAIEVAIVLRHV